MNSIVIVLALGGGLLFAASRKRPRTPPSVPDTGGTTEPLRVPKPPTDPYTPVAVRTLTLDANDDGTRVTLNNFEHPDAIAHVDSRPAWAVLRPNSAPITVLITSRHNIEAISDVKVHAGHIADQTKMDVLAQLEYSVLEDKIFPADWAIEFTVRTVTGKTHLGRIYVVRP